MINCDDCGAEMQEPCLCLVMFTVLDDHSREERVQRISNLCERCRAFKRNDVRTARPLTPRVPVKVFRAPSKFSIAFELFKGRRVPEPVFLNGKPIWLYGKGELGQLAERFFHSNGIEVAGSFQYDEAAPLDAQVVICIVRNSPYGEIEKRLSDRGFKDIVHFYDLTNTINGVHPLKRGWIGRLESADCIKIEEVLERWSDDASRCHYLQFLAWMILREEWIFKGLEVTKDNIYFIPEIVAVLTDHETVLDGGAYRGETVERFLKVGARVIAVEPDDENREILKERCPAAEVLDFALSDIDGEATFSEGFDMTSDKILSGNTLKVTRRIDSLGLSPSFIKLYINSGNLVAFRGAQETLVRCRPIIAVRIDYNSDGMWRIADFLMNLLTDYRFLFRNHCWCGGAAVVYAIPEERHAV